MFNLNGVQYAESLGSAVNAGPQGVRVAEAGERVALSREQVVATAVDLLRRYGLGDLSMRRLARELGVAPGALYWHVANKQELLVEVADVLLAEIPEPAGDRPPAEALAALAVAVREASCRCPTAPTSSASRMPSSRVPLGRCVTSLGSSTSWGARVRA